jgi:hypothetical protein
MSDDDQAGVRRDILIKALRRCFVLLDEADAEKIADELLLDTISFGSSPVVIRRNFDPADPILAAFLAPMGDRAHTLLDALDSDDRARRLRWSPQHHFLYVEPA